MSKSKVQFIELSSRNKLNAVCDITEKLYEKHQSLVIHVQDAQEAASLSRYMWSWKPESFIPHEITSKPQNENITSVQIVTDPEYLLQADVLIQHDPSPAENLTKFHLIIDFAEIYNADKLQESRQRFKKLRDNNQFELEFLKLGTFLGR